MPTVPFLDLKADLEPLRRELDAAQARVLDRGNLILGPEVEAFEAEFAAYVGANYCVGVGNGFDALRLSLLGADLNAGDDVIVPSNTYIATWLAISAIGAHPVPVEPDPATFNIDPSLIGAAITERTKAVLPVHLYGHPVDMDPVIEIAGEYQLATIDDCAQAHGARYKTRLIGSLCDASAWSFYPTKNLGALGDGGAITTDDAALAERLRRLRNYGSAARGTNDEIGWNSRLDEIQAAFLRVKLKHLDENNRRRAEIAAFYLSALDGLPVKLPSIAAWADPAWHLFVIRAEDRDGLRGRLADRGVETFIHYPVAPHLQPAYRDLALTPGSLPISELLHTEVLSLPLGPHMKDNQVEFVVDALKDALTCR